MFHPLAFGTARPSPRLRALNGSARHDRRQIGAEVLRKNSSLKFRPAMIVYLSIGSIRKFGSQKSTCSSHSAISSLIVTLSSCKSSASIWPFSRINV